MRASRARDIVAFMTKLVLAACAGALVVMPRTVRADVVPPDAYACDRNAAPGFFDASKTGTACEVSGSKGACQKSTCQGIDYASWDRDASPTPPSKTFDCLKCVADAQPSTSSSGDGGATSPASSDDSGCSVGRAPLRAAVPWLLALAVPVVVSASRRRKRGA